MPRKAHHVTTVSRRQTHAQAARKARLGKGRGKGKSQIASHSSITPLPAQIPASTAPSTLHHKSSAPQAPQLLTITQASQALAVSHWTVREWVQKGLLPSIRLPGTRLIRIASADLAHMIDAGRC
jgi:excisionase family DNA binding protein